MLRRIALYAIAVPAAVILIALAVANRHGVRLVLDPFRPDDPVISLVLPFYVYLIGTLIVGVLIGGWVAWRSQAHWRRTARKREFEAQRWQAEAERLRRDREKQAAPARQIAAVNR